MDIQTYPKQHKFEKNSLHIITNNRFVNNDNLMKFFASLQTTEVESVTCDNFCHMETR